MSNQPTLSAPQPGVIVQQDLAMAVSRPMRVDPTLLAEKAREVHRRLVERFPHADLRHVAARIVLLVEGVRKRAARDQHSGVFTRMLILFLMLALLGGGGYAAFIAAPPFTTPSWVELVQAGEAGVQLLILVTIGVLWCWSAGHRARRQRQLGYLGELREIVNILDLFQLDKDPDRLDRSATQSTASSPQLGEVNSPFLMGRYLDYVSELLAVVSTLAAYYAATAQDDTVLGVVREIGASAGQHRVHIGQKSLMLTNAHGAPSA